MTLISEQTALEHKIDDLTTLVGEMHTALVAEQRRRARLEELVGDAMPALRVAADRTAAQLDAFERRGYFAFAKAGVEVVDEVVSHFGEDDVRQLGDHVVAILETLKELTQPEMLALLHQAVEAVERQRVAVEAEPTEPPTLWQLFRTARTPEVRRGLGRTLGTLSAMSAEPRTDSRDDLKEETRR